MSSLWQSFARELSKVAGVATKGFGADSATLDSPQKAEVAHGLEGRLRRLPAPGAAATKIEGPRAYAPRLKKV